MLQELSQVVEDIEILITRLNTKDYWAAFGPHFYDIIFSDNVATKCKMVVARVVGKKRTNTRRGRSTALSTEEFLQSEGFNFDSFNFKGKFCKALGS